MTGGVIQYKTTALFGLKNKRSEEKKPLCMEKYQVSTENNTHLNMNSTAAVSNWRKSRDPITGKLQPNVTASRTVELSQKPLKTTVLLFKAMQRWTNIKSKENLLCYSHW